MDMELAFALLITVVVLGLIFEFVNGFHDAANAIATAVGTGVLAPQTAVIMAGIMNFLGALSGTAVAATIGKGIISPESVTQITVVAALLAAIIWDLVTWYYGLPSSSSHALVGGIIGAGLATNGVSVIVWAGIKKVLIGLFFSPVLGFVGGFGIMIAIYWLFRKTLNQVANRLFGRLQILSAAYMAFSHGSNDGQKTMGIIALALVSFYNIPTEEFSIPWWVIISCALAIGGGTYVGGWKIIKTMAFNMTSLKPVQGFGAEFIAATLIETATRLGIPVSTTHTISTSIMGVGAAKRFTAVRWIVVTRIAIAWVLTIPACVVIGYGLKLGLDKILL